jgi:hypothetical protein
MDKISRVSNENFEDNKPDDHVEYPDMDRELELRYREVGKAIVHRDSLVSRAQDGGDGEILFLIAQEQLDDSYKRLTDYQKDPRSWRLKSDE